MASNNSIDVWFGVNPIGECFFLDQYSESDFVKEFFLCDLYRAGPLILEWPSMCELAVTVPGLYKITLYPIFHFDQKDPMCTWESESGAKLICETKCENKNETEVPEGYRHDN